MQAERQDRLRQDTLRSYKLLAMAFIRESKPDSALLFLDKASSYANTSDERDAIGNDMARASSVRIRLLIDKRSIPEALQGVNAMLVQSPGQPSLLYQRALCYSKLGNIQDAVADLQIPMSQGYEGAEDLHEKINPIRKRVSYYLTRCCDGSPSPSNAKGRGACSHHGGVCDWNEAVYEEYRKY